MEQHHNDMAVCDLCGEASELVDGACSGCRAQYQIDTPTCENVARRAAVRFALRLLVQRAIKQAVHQHGIDQGEHSANDVYPILLDRRRQCVQFDLSVAPFVRVDDRLRPTELVLDHEAIVITDILPVEGQQQPLLFGQRWDDELRETNAGMAWQESLNIEVGAAA